MTPILILPCAEDMASTGGVESKVWPEGVGNNEWSWLLDKLQSLAGTQLAEWKQGLLELRKQHEDKAGGQYEWAIRGLHK